MRQYDILKMAESVIKTISENGINPADVYHLAMYEDYQRLKKEGLKVTYVVNYLIQQYGVPEATIYRVVKRMQKEI